MSKRKTKASQGRPKTVNRDHSMDVAMHAYWGEGIGNLSLNEICRRCAVSKPGVHREFGSEDGVMKAVLLAYQEQLLTPLQQTLTTEAPFRETLDHLVTIVTAGTN